MTGEMSHIDQNGLDSNGETWEMHAAVAKALGGELRAWDVYQGPYIKIPGAGPIWLYSENGHEGIAYREDTDKKSDSFPLYGEYSDDLAINAVAGLLDQQ